VVDVHFTVHAVLVYLCNAKKLRVRTSISVLLSEMRDLCMKAEKFGTSLINPNKSGVILFLSFF